MPDLKHAEAPAYLEESRGIENAARSLESATQIVPRASGDLLEIRRGVAP